MSYGCGYQWKVFVCGMNPWPLALVVRSHEVKDQGYEVDHGGKCITVFSAPNYW